MYPVPCSSSLNIIGFVFPVHATCPIQPEPVDFIIPVATCIYIITDVGYQSRSSDWAMDWMSVELWFDSQQGEEICLCVF